MTEWINTVRQSYNITKLSKNDETKFAEAEARNLLEKINKEKSNKLKIWERTSLNKPLQEKDLRFKNMLPKIKTEVMISKNNLSKKYLNDEEIKQIQEATQISINKKAISQNILFSSKDDTKMPIAEYINLNKNIWLKNVLLNILNKERKVILNKEGRVQKSLEVGYLKLEKDIDKFKNYCDNEKSKQKDAEGELHNFIQKNKDLLDNKRKLIHDQKSITDEFEKLIKHIMISKSYAIFACYSLGNKDYLDTYFNLNGFNFNTFEYNESIMKDKTISKQVNLILSESNRYDYRNALRGEILTDLDALFKKFLYLEERILNQTKENQDLKNILTKLEQDKEDFEKDILIKRKKIKNELSLLIKESESYENDIKQLSNKISHSKSQNKLKSNKHEEDYLNELYFLVEKSNSNIMKSPTHITSYNRDSFFEGKEEKINIKNIFETYRK